MIERKLAEELLSKLGKGKAVLVFGPRKVGKITLLRSLSKDQENILWLNGCDADTQALFEAQSVSLLN
jgi:predicted AAA+ superfamily ATPase